MNQDIFVHFVKTEIMKRLDVLLRVEAIFLTSQHAFPELPPSCSCVRILQM